MRISYKTTKAKIVITQCNREISKGTTYVVYTALLHSFYMTVHKPKHVADMKIHSCDIGYW